MKKIIGTMCLGMTLLALGMGVPSQAYSDACRGCWSYCLSPLPIGEYKDCRHCNALCDTSQLYLSSGFCR